MFLLGCSNTTTEGKTDVSAIEPKKEEKIDVYFKDNEAKLNDLKINITETKVILPGEPGNEYGEKPVFAIWYDVTNLSDKELDPSSAWFIVFEVIQDNNPNSINKLDVGMLPDDRFLDTQSETIKKGGTVRNAVAYELDDLITSVTIIASQGLLGDELGKKEFEIK